jgi:hypothetical protein
MGNVEPQRRSHGLLLVRGGQHALRDVAATAGLGARIPRAPPLHGKRHDEHGEHGRGIGKIREQRQLVVHEGIGHQAA